MCHPRRARLAIQYGLTEFEALRERQRILRHRLIQIRYTQRLLIYALSMANDPNVAAVACAAIARFGHRAAEMMDARAEAHQLEQDPEGEAFWRCVAAIVREMSGVRGMR